MIWSLGHWYVNGPGGTAGVWLNLQFSNGQTASIAAMGNFTVFRPSVSLEPFNTTPSFYAADGYPPYVSLGGDGDPRSQEQHEMAYYAHYNAGKYSGAGGIAQLLTMDYSGPLGPRFSDWRLDGNSEMYASGPVSPPPNLNLVFFSDSPKNGHLYIWGTIRCKANFKDYCMFQPNGGISVTLGIVTWSCDGESPSVNVLSVNSVTGPSGPDDSDEFPEWEQNFPEGTGQ